MKSGSRFIIKKNVHNFPFFKFFLDCSNKEQCLYAIKLLWTLYRQFWFRTRWASWFFCFFLELVLICRDPKYWYFTSNTLSVRMEVMMILILELLPCSLTSLFDFTLLEVIKIISKLLNVLGVMVEYCSMTLSC